MSGSGLGLPDDTARAAEWWAVLDQGDRLHPAAIHRRFMALADREQAALRVEVDSLRRQVAEAKQAESDHMQRCAAFVSEITPRALAAESVVAAIRDLAAQEPRRTDYLGSDGQYLNAYGDGFNHAIEAIRAALEEPQP